METQKIAEERIRILFSQAEKKFEEDRELSDRYVELAGRIGEKAEVSIPSELKKKSCRECNSYLKPGKNCTVRIDSEKKLIRYMCGECGAEMKYGY